MPLRPSSRSLAPSATVHSVIGWLQQAAALLSKKRERHELRRCLASFRPTSALARWRLPSGLEVDLVVGDMDLAIAATASYRIHGGHLKWPRAMARDYIGPTRRPVVCLESKSRRIDDGIESRPALEFPERLRDGHLKASHVRQRPRVHALRHAACQAIFGPLPPGTARHSSVPEPIYEAVRDPVDDGGNGGHQYSLDLLSDQLA